MACGGCKETQQNGNVDKRGNVVTGEAVMSSAEQSMIDEARARVSNIPKPPGSGGAIFSMSYKDYLKEKEVFRQKGKVVSGDAAKSFSKDYKRILIQQMLDVANYEEVGRISPEQAVVALWEFAHSEYFTEVIDEFEGLRKSIDIRYEMLMKNKIPVDWKP